VGGHVQTDHLPLANEGLGVSPTRCTGWASMNSPWQKVTSTAVARRRGQPAGPNDYVFVIDFTKGGRRPQGAPAADWTPTIGT